MLCVFRAFLSKTGKEGQRKAQSIKVKKCYINLFRNFIAFCICGNINLTELSVSVVLSFLEYLVGNQLSVHMISNCLSAVKAMAIVYKLNYFIKTLKMNRQYKASPKNIIDIKMLGTLVDACNALPHTEVLRAIFLTAFFCCFFPYIKFSTTCSKAV